MKRKMVITVVGIMLLGVLIGGIRGQKDAENVMNDVWEKYDVQSYQIGETEPIIWVDMYDKNEINKVEKYLKDNLSKDDLKKFELRFTSDNEGID